MAADEILNIARKVDQAIRSVKVRQIALTTVLAIHKPRIFEKGQAQDGSQIGTYSTNPISISKSKQARNTGKTFFKTGWAEYKTAIGKNPGYVNLRNTDQMMGDYGLIQNGDSYAFGFQNEENAKKMGYMVDKYNKEIAHLSDKEIELLGDVLMDGLTKSL